MTTPTNNKAEGKTLDELFELAERQTRAVDNHESPVSAITADNGESNMAMGVDGPGPLPATISQSKNKPKPCEHPSVDPTLLKTCPLCHWPFCPNCQSLIDTQYCHLCLSVATAELVSSPLVDQDGVTHEGRLLTPGPIFGTFAKGVSEMSLHELEQHIEKFKHLIKQAEVGLDFYRVGQATMQMEFEQRKEQQRRRLRGVKLPRAVRSVSVTDPASAARSGKPAAKVPMDLSKMVKMIEALKQLQQLKKQQAQSAAGIKSNETKSTT